MVQLIKQRCHGIFLPMPDGYRKYQNQSSWSNWCSKQRIRVLHRLAFSHVFSRCNQSPLFPHFPVTGIVSGQPGSFFIRCGPAVPARLSGQSHGNREHLWHETTSHRLWQTGRSVHHSAGCSFQHTYGNRQKKYSGTVWK